MWFMVVEKGGDDGDIFLTQESGRVEMESKSLFLADRSVCK